MSAGKAIEIGSSAIVAVAAITMVTLHVANRRPAEERPRYATATEVPSWLEDIKHGIPTGPAQPSVTITEFVDFECPYCAQLAPTVDSIVNANRESVALVFMHFPLSSHPNAVPAAIAAECADRQGSFWPMYHALFEGQHDMGTSEWAAFASDAGLPDIETFTECIRLPADSFPRIAMGREIGRRTGVMGTPTIWINGKIAPADPDGFRRMMADALRSSRNQSE